VKRKCDNQNKKRLQRYRQIGEGGHREIRQLFHNSHDQRTSEGKRVAAALLLQLAVKQLRLYE
jgi:hypothetical protein